MSTTLALYGNTQDIEKFATRIRDLMPGGNRLSANQAMALAQVAIVHGLDPFNGEVWHIIDSKGVSRGIQIGIKGLRKKARQQLKGNFWTSFRELADPAERKRLMIPDSALAFECRLFDSETVGTYTETIKTLRSAEVPIVDTLEIVGKQPYTSGIGVFRSGEQSLMLPVQCAMKRAEADAVKRRFDVPFDVAEDDLPMNATSGYIDGSFTTQAGERVDTTTGEIAPAAEPEHANGNGKAQKTAEELSNELTGKRAPLTRPYPAEKVRENLRALAGASTDMPQPDYLQGAMASLSGLVSGDDDQRHAILKYLFGVDSGKQLRKGQVKALRGWMDVKQNADGEWIPNGHSVNEARAIVATAAELAPSAPLPERDPAADVVGYFTEKAAEAGK